METTSPRCDSFGPAHAGVGSGLSQSGIDARVDVEVGRVDRASLGDRPPGQTVADRQSQLGHLGAHGGVSLTEDQHAFIVETVVSPSVAAKLAERVSGPELSEREKVVLQALATGQSNKEIGRTLFISETTVKAHLKSIFTKLNVLSRTEAIAVALRRGMVRP